MKCPHCGAYGSLVLDARLVREENAKYRRHTCRACKQNWVSMEVPTDCRNVKFVVLCEECEIHGCCMMENALKLTGTKTPFCGAGKRKR